MSDDKEPKLSLTEYSDIPDDINADNFKDILDPIAFKATYAAMVHPDAFPLGKIASLYLRGRGYYGNGEGGGGITNNYFNLVLNASDQQLQELEQKALASIGSGSTQSCPSGEVAAGNPGKGKRKPALLASRAHKDVR